MALLHLLRGGHVACVQELHWSAQDGGVWAGLFPACQVVSSAARPGPRGGPQGGVAIVIPDTYEVLNKRTVVPGLYVEATVRQRGAPTQSAWVVQSLYLPPDDRRSAADAGRQSWARRGGVRGMRVDQADAEAQER